jgi:ABC-2 type transport system permease protein
MLAVLVNLVIFNLVTLVLSVSMVKYYIKPGESINDIYLLMVGMFLGQLIFAALGSWLAAVSRKPKQAASLGTAILLVMFILSIAIDLNSKLENLKYITPFKFYEAKTVLIDGALDPVYVTISVVVIVAMISATYVFYRKRDLNV